MTLLSKRQVNLQYGLNFKHITTLLDVGVLVVDPNSTPRRPKIPQHVVEALVEGEHYIVCQACGAWVAALSERHTQACAGISVAGYRVMYPDSPIACSVTAGNRKKTDAQKQAQSAKLKARFKTADGERTKQQIRDRSLKLHYQEGYREKAAAHLRKLSQDPQNRKALSRKSRKAWAKDGKAREKAAAWRAENPEKVRQSALNARRHSKKKRSNLHLGFKEIMVRAGLTGFRTEHEVRWYSIDEARPDIKLAVEVDGCYWHSCPTCGLAGPKGTLQYDARKTTYLKSRGWTILRLWGHDIRSRPAWCVDQVRAAVAALEASDGRAAT